jgi:MFS family permease
MAGLILTSTVGGQIVSRTGRYRMFPIVGTAFMTIGGFLLAQLTPTTSTVTAGIYMFITGFGIGLVMQVLVVAVQNAVRYEDLGVATSGTTLLRNTGSSIGTAIVGTVFATQLASRLAAAFPHSTGVVLNTSHPTTAELDQLPAGVRTVVIQAYSSSLDRAFLVGAFISIIAFAASWFITELPMRTTIQAKPVEDDQSDSPQQAITTVDAGAGSSMAQEVRTAPRGLAPAVALAASDELPMDLSFPEGASNGQLPVGPLRDTITVPSAREV